MNDLIKCIQQDIINCDYVDIYCPYHICHIYEIWRTKDVGDALKSSFGVAMQATRGEGIILTGKERGVSTM